VHLDESLFAESVVAMRADIPDGISQITLSSDTSATKPVVQLLPPISCSDFGEVGLEPLIPMETKPLQPSKMEDCLLAEEVSVVAAFPMLDSAGVVASVKAFVKHSTPVRGFLRRGFLNPSLSVQVTPHFPSKVSVASSSTLIIKEGGM
jgi:hypothetical protein